MPENGRRKTLSSVSACGACYSITVDRRSVKLWPVFNHYFLLKKRKHEKFRMDYKFLCLNDTKKLFPIIYNAVLEPNGIDEINI